MPFFQNPFSSPDFYGVWLLGDRQHSLDFKCPRNAGRGDEYVISLGTAPFDLSGNDGNGDSKDVLTISFALNDFKNWADLEVTITADSLAATTAQEVVTSLSNNAVFSDRFTTSVDRSGRVTIRQKKPVTQFRFYVKNGRAETSLLFNKMAGVAELPSYFARHTIDNRYAYVDSQNALIQLDPSSTVDADVIDNAVDERGASKGFDSSTVKADYQFLTGRSGIFNFQKLTVDGSDRITEIIEYPAGAKVGDLARKINYTYTGANTKPDQITEIPYTLDTGDLITP